MSGEENDAIVSAALALIDEVYGASLSHDTNPSRRSEVQRLRQEIDNLERVLAPEQRPLDGTSRTALWADIATRQRRLRHDAVGENAVLRQYVQKHTALAHRLQEKLAPLLADYESLVAPRTDSTIPWWPSHLSSAQVLIEQRLATLAHNTSRKWSGWCATVGTTFHDHHVTTNRGGDGLELQYRYAGYVPFDLSLVVTEFWRMVLEESFGSYGVSPSPPHEVFGPHILHWSRSLSTHLQVHGPCGVRRVELDDGSVVIVAASIAHGSPDSVSTNILHNCEMHGATWLRIGQASTSSSLVYFETCCFLEIRRISKHHEKPWEFERIRDTMLQIGERAGKNNAQKLENRWLDVTMASARNHM